MLRLAGYRRETGKSLLTPGPSLKDKCINLLSTQEIVIKPLNRLIRQNNYFAGSSIIGSGEVVLILDIANLVITKNRMTSAQQIDLIEQATTKGR